MQVENLYADSAIRTRSGIYFNIISPTIDMINIDDIAHALSHQCRFSGHINKFYSVAEHSINCAKFVTKENKLSALLHDASEAYLVDIPSPIKPHLTNYKTIEDSVMDLISKKYSFEYPLNEEIKYIDRFFLEKEWNILMLGLEDEIELSCYSPEQAKQNFIKMFNLLVNGYETY